ncbi:aldehyde ferredoxin oxidoreductase family protein [Clostridium sp. CM028]|uniref:aldehyde ferredoxin oxidoreductase family protein n=1 Tax=unclassified Clostridium TaxID=2614128 RepID=UPI001C6F5527|nr:MULTISPECIES: aldehyde ferredoxin oxidoreductase family protein [unclassified Clostridium]MBW9145574.1 aldehyde ferredoxin oxidoreductase family protein [Clostridium sp. CM027]MBW9148922.1 aldehyde ferredoxin oxidoreductase family protein [Clostridium sp. CM028]UVE42405.1 aldehyde ferredoxin oxidoreductase family protein [Clostridium sp. CM027]WLC62976.1 aldehyde ferredoxin oxidoreductase family protein [Clostridium sp. CM028]
MYGYNGKILRINLKDKTIKVEVLDLKQAKKFIGGRGLGTKIFMDEVDPRVDPLSPENKLIIITGPLTGTPVPTGGRYMVVTKSPQSGTIACSNSGGYWGAEFKATGYDMIIFEDKADAPVYLTIIDDKVEIKDASSLWGKLVTETTDILRKEMPDKSRVMTIGPAGEGLSNMAAIMNDYDRAAARSGVGAVMGSKNLKAIVVKGSSKPQVADATTLKEVSKVWLKTIKANGVTGTGLPTYGTAVLVNILNENGIYPTNNFQKSYFEKADDVSGEAMTKDYLVRKNPCYRCPIACGRYVKIEDMGIEVGGPEYETLWAFSGDCGISDMVTTFKANYWCNEYGMDTISVGTTIAAAMELREKGYIKDEELGGTPLEFGNIEGVVDWTIKIGKAEGLGAKMSEGSYRLCASYGAPEFSMSVKKLEIPAYDPRGIMGQGLQFATSNRGGCHVRGYMISPEILGLPQKLDRFSLEGKATWVKIFQDLTASIDSLGLCLFTSFAMGAQDYANLYNAVCGTEHTAESILDSGDRIWNIERQFNLQAGIDATQDTLPKRLLEEPIPEGPSKGNVHRLSELLPSYYNERGWNEKGIPTEEKLKELGL